MNRDNDHDDGGLADTGLADTELSSAPDAKAGHTPLRAALAAAHTPEGAPTIPADYTPAPDREISAPDNPFPAAHAGRYQVIAEHARGGLGRVIRARDRHLGRTVAIKELHQISALAESLFVREALITARLQHPGIVPVHETGRWSSGAPFYVMKLISGKSLQELIRQRPTLAQRLALLPNAIAAVETMAYAHSQGVIHRDIKPANVVIGEFGETVVVDWGLARHRGQEAPASGTARPADARPADARNATSTWQTPTTDSVSGKVVGTPAYMAPEQARGEEVDERADVYALGALLYELLAGKAPYADQQMHGVPEQVLAQVRAGPPPALGTHREPIPPDLITIVDKAMAREPAARYPSAKELAEDLARFQTGQLVSAHRYSTWTLVRRWLWRHRSAVLVAVAGLVALAVTGGLGVNRVIEERNRAEAERTQARLAQQKAEEQGNELLLLQAEAALDRDPTTTLAWLKQAPLDRDGSWLPIARNLYDEAVARGVARHVVKHDDLAIGLCFTPDGAHLLSTGKDGTVRMLDVSTGAHRVIARSSEGLGSVTLSPDGAWLVAGTDEGALQVWPMGAGHEGAPLHRVPGHTDVIYRLWFVDDDTLVSIAEDRSLRIWRWSPAGPAVVRTFEATAAIATMRTWVALGHASGEVIVLDMDTGAEVWRTVLPEPPRVLRLSPDGKHLAVESASDALRLVDIGTGAIRSLGDVHNPYNMPLLAFSPRGRWLVTAGESWSMHLWDLRSGQERRLRGHENGIYMLDFSAEDELLMATASDDGTARLWDLSTGRAQVLRGHTDDVVNVQISPRGDTVATASLDGSVRLWPIGSTTSKRIDAHQAPVSTMRFTNAETLVSLDTRGEARSWHMPSAEGSLLARMTSARHAPRAFSPDNRFLALGQRDAGHIDIRDMAANTHHTLETGDMQITRLALAPGGKELVTADDTGNVYLWRVGQDGGPLELRRGAEVCNMMWSPNGAMLAIVTPLRAEVWDMERRASDDAFAMRGSGACMPNQRSLVMFSPDSALLAVPANLHGMMLWNLHTRSVQHIETHRHRLTGIAFSPDGKVLAGSLADRSTWLWPLAGSLDDIEAKRLGHHDDLIMQVAFSPDGRLLATSSYDSDVRLWNLATGTFRALYGHGHSVDTLAFSPDGAWLASGGRDGAIHLWNIREDPIPDTATLRAHGHRDHGRDRG